MNRYGLGICEKCEKPYGFPLILEVCKACGDLDVHEKSVGDEGFTVCNACQGIEQGYVEKEFCPNCEEPLE